MRFRRISIADRGAGTSGQTSCGRRSIVGEWLSAVFAVALLSAGNASAQVIRPESALEYAVRQVEPFLEVTSRAQYSSNALSVSNLPGGLGLPAERDVFWQNTVAAGAVYSVSPAITVYLGGSLSHTNFFKYSDLNYVGLAGQLAVDARISRSLHAYAGFVCSSERDDESLREFYGFCGPTVGASWLAGSPTGRVNALFGVSALSALGSRLDFSRYQEVQGFINFQLAMHRVQMKIQPYGYFRRYDVAPQLSLSGNDRKDYRAGLSTALLYNTRRIQFGVEANPSANWSNYAQYRYWDFRAGPVVRARF